MINKAFQTLSIILCCFGLTFAQQSIIFKNVNVIPINTNVVLLDRDVLVKNGVIETIEKSSNKKYKDATIVDAKGQYLMPGLTDMHVHIPRQSKYGYGAEAFFALELAAGVTSVRSMRGAEADLIHQKQQQTGQLVGPNLYTSAPPFYASRVWVSADSLTKLIKKYKQQGFQSLKVLSVPSVAWFDTLAQVAQKEGLMLSGHSPNGIPIEYVLDKSMKSIEHLGGYENLKIGSPELDNALAKTLKNNTFNCPTLDWYFVNYTQITYEAMKKRAGLDRLPPALVADWTKTFDDYFAQQAKTQLDSLQKEQAAEKQYIDKKIAILAELHKKGAKLLVSPDASTVFQVPGLSVIEEMKWYKRAAISNYEILKAATYNAADYVGETQKWGSIQKGLKADLILLNANPLDDLDNLHKLNGVMLNGKWLPSSKLDQMLQNIKQSYREQP